MTDLRVTLVQTSLVWHDPGANRQLLEQKLQSLAGQTDLVVLPEMFTSGFTIHPEGLYNESATADWLLLQAQTLNIAITGSIATAIDVADETKPNFANRLLFATPEGELFHYDKVHLFRMGDEHLRYQPGKERVVLEYNGWRLLLTVCYDLRFPVFCRNRQDYDAMICVANWPDSRRLHWRTLLQARAIENQAYVVGVNRVGKDGQGLSYSGDSLAINYLGDLLIDEPGEWERTMIFNRNALEAYKKKFPAWRDADEFTVHLHP